MALVDLRQRLANALDVTARQQLGENCDTEWWVCTREALLDAAMKEIEAVEGKP